MAPADERSLLFVDRHTFTVLKFTHGDGEPTESRHPSRCSQNPNGAERPG
jgi:hypothetical protein